MLCGALERAGPGPLPGELARTRSRLLRAPPALVRHAADADALVIAFAYAPATWQVEHVIGADWDLVGRLLAELRGLDGHVRVVAAPDDPRSMPALARAARLVPHADVALALLDYGLADVGEPVACGVTVRTLRSGEQQLAPAFYGALLHRAELASLQLEDLTLATLDAGYAEQGLTRTRTVLAAFDATRRPVGMCIVNHGSPGLSAQLLENAIEHIRVAPRLRAEEHRRVWRALLAAALAEAGTQRGWTAVLVEPDDRQLALAAGLTSPQPRRRAVLTFHAGDDTFARALG